MLCRSTLALSLPPDNGKATSLNLSATTTVRHGEAVPLPCNANIYIYTPTLIWRFYKRFFKTCVLSM
ncbi:hypothetical protein BDA96_01G268100 [Sorghum bicolor]|uniref:Uncharacterized protein n=1 Tax=Sorghum bicolor TaxID=4558 RepID=A0A921R7Y4_SORBI|nr:hypothetical protein BDA96_04G369600 [Sorghum bicolor]KAG0549594.1 hypothetical protein BDA96_01G268100 [Sorghum bicolor]